MVPSDVPSEGAIYKDVKSPPEIYFLWGFQLENGTGQGKGYGIFFISPVILELKPIFDRHSRRELKWQLYEGEQMEEFWGVRSMMVESLLRRGQACFNSIAFLRKSRLPGIQYCISDRRVQGVSHWFRSWKSPQCGLRATVMTIVKSDCPCSVIIPSGEEKSH